MAIARLGVLNSPLYLKDNFDALSIVSCPFLSFSTLNMSFHSLLDCNIFTEISTDTLIRAPL